MKLINNILKIFGFKVSSLNDANISFSDIDDQEFWELYEQVKDYTMVSIPNIYSLFNSVKYVIQNQIAGDIVECGVWRGGCSMMIALTLKKYNSLDKKIYMYDTYEGMSEPTELDLDFNNSKAQDQLKTKRSLDRNSVWCIADINDVKTNIRKTSYPFENFVFIKGKVEDTLKNNIPNDGLSLLRLDTDWFESTKEELIHLYPKLNQNGILIIDDYGHWQGARTAVNEYFSKHKIDILLNRVDYTCRLGIKIK